MTRKRRTRRTRRVSAQNLKKLLKAETKENLIKLLLGGEGIKVRGKKRGPGRPKKRGPGRPKKSSSRRGRKTGRGSWAKNPAHRYKSGPKKGKLMSKAAFARHKGSKTHRGPGRPRKVGRPRSRKSRSGRGSYAKYGQRYTSGPLKGRLMPRSSSSGRSYEIPGLKQPKFHKRHGSLESVGAGYWTSGE